jgi:hypothetical protein
MVTKEIDAHSYIDQARKQLEEEQDAVEAKLEAYKAFIRRASDLSTGQSPSPTPGITATAAKRYSGHSSVGNQCQIVREAFEQTIQPHSVADIGESESLLTTIRHELTDSIAIALAPATDTSFSPPLKQMILTEAESRRSETAIMLRALRREETQLEDADTVCSDITSWITEHDQPLASDLGFETLQQRHETVAAHRNRLENLSHNRQHFLKKGTGRNSGDRLQHRDITHYLYQSLTVDHPVLATVAHLDTAYKEYQQMIRDYLVRYA